jgi:hypothetical protein
MLDAKAANGTLGIERRSKHYIVSKTIDFANRRAICLPECG